MKKSRQMAIETEAPVLAGRHVTHPMIGRRLALICHSGAGKSACLAQLAAEPRLADMDVALGTHKSPALEVALRWLTDESTGQTVVVVSNHE